MSQKSNQGVSRAWRLAILYYHEVAVERVIRKDTTKVKLCNVTHKGFNKITRNFISSPFYGDLQNIQYLPQ